MIAVEWSWGEGAYDRAELEDGDEHVVATDGPLGYELIKIKREGDKIVIVPRCLMIAAKPESLRKYADILDSS